MNHKRMTLLLVVLALLVALPFLATIGVRAQGQEQTAISAPQRDMSAEKDALDGRSSGNGPAPLAPGDPFEPNNRIPKATPLTYGSIIDATISPAGDVDYFKFTGQAGDPVSIRIFASGSGSFLDPVVTLFGPNGRTEAAFNDDYIGLDSFLSYILPVDGTFFIKVEDFGDPNGGPEYFYTLNVDKVVYVSAMKNGVVDGLPFASGDILAHHQGGGYWEILFDASDVGIGRNVTAFEFAPFGCLLMSFNGNVRFDGFTAKPQDIVGFCPFSLGEDTSGFFFEFLDGAALDLNTSSEAIDAIEQSLIPPDYPLLVSTTGNFAVGRFPGPYPGPEDLTGGDEDILALSPFGSWEIYLDGSDVPGLGSEDVTGLAVDDESGDLYLTVQKNFNVGGVVGDNNDIFIVRHLGAGVYNAEFFWDASSVGLNQALDGISLGP